MPAWGPLFSASHGQPAVMAKGAIYIAVTITGDPCQKACCGRMTPPLSNNTLLLLVTHEQTRDFLLKFLEAHEYAPRGVGTPRDVLQSLKGQEQATVFVDCQTVSTYGPGLYAKMKVACPGCRVVLLCDKSHHDHRDLVKEAMDLGIYACLLAPFAEWEILAMVRRSQATRSPGRRQARTREKR